MVALIAENARVGSYTDEFDERYRRIAEEINTLKEEQIEARRKKKLADSYEPWLKDMDSFLEKQTCQIPVYGKNKMPDGFGRFIVGINNQKYFGNTNN